MIKLLPVAAVTAPESRRKVTRTGRFGATMCRTGKARCSGGVCTGSCRTTEPRSNTVTR